MDRVLAGGFGGHQGQCSVFLCWTPGQRSLFMSLLVAKGYLGGWGNAPDVNNQCLQVLSGDRQNKQSLPLGNNGVGVPA